MGPCRCHNTHLHQLMSEGALLDVLDKPQKVKLQRSDEVVGKVCFPQYCLIVEKQNHKSVIEQLLSIAGLVELNNKIC